MHALTVECSYIYTNLKERKMWTAITGSKVRGVRVQHFASVFQVLHSNRGLWTLDLTLGHFTSPQGVVGPSCSLWMMEIMMLDLNVNSMGHEKINKWFQLCCFQNVYLFLPTPWTTGPCGHVTEQTGLEIMLLLPDPAVWENQACAIMPVPLDTGHTVIIQPNTYCLEFKISTILDKLRDFWNHLEPSWREFALYRRGLCRAIVRMYSPWAEVFNIESILENLSVCHFLDLCCLIKIYSLNGILFIKPSLALSVIEYYHLCFGHLILCLLANATIHKKFGRRECLCSWVFCLFICLFVIL